MPSSQPFEPKNLTPLGMLIERHWRKHRPKMTKALEAKGKLWESVWAAQELTADLLWELTVVKKLAPDQARELAMPEWALLPTEEDQPTLGFEPTSLIDQVPAETIESEMTTE